MSGSRGETLRHRLAGVVFVLVPVLLIWLAVAVYDKEFTDSDPVVVETGSAGNQMRPGAEVKLRGVVVGEVRAIDATGDGARLTLAMKPGALDAVPADVRAQMLPTTLFGERFVALVPPPDPSAETLAAGAVVPQDRSENAIELQQVLDDVLPMLTAVQPQKLSATLSAVSQALEGRGDELGETLTRLDRHLGSSTPAPRPQPRPQGTREGQPCLRGRRARHHHRAHRLHHHQRHPRRAGGPARRHPRRHDPDGRGHDRVPAEERGQHHPARRHEPAHPGTARRVLLRLPLHPAHPRRVRARDGPGARQGHRTARHPRRPHHRPSRGAYRPGPDTPVYDSGGGPRCPSVPYLGSLPRPAAPAAGPAAGQDLGPANSPSENDLVNELLAPAAGESPGDLPDWSSLLAGPVYRGTEVTLG
ncbi:hypothetical protein SHKM778_75850 [Streptomyces sp. KM77-8]|uniref:MCE family protein n=1 Tax=Streptomyces haneummycinicus TaxID=3074435 RepID=A0AAT9HV95_9ACTN